MRLAQEASVDAEVALARTRTLKAERALRDVNAGTQTLRSESERGAAREQAAPTPASSIRTVSQTVRLSRTCGTGLLAIRAQSHKC